MATIAGIPLCLSLFGRGRQTLGGAAPAWRRKCPSGPRSASSGPPWRSSVAGPRGDENGTRFKILRFRGDVIRGNRYQVKVDRYGEKGKIHHGAPKEPHFGVILETVRYAPVLLFLDNVIYDD